MNHQQSISTIFLNSGASTGFRTRSTRLPAVFDVAGSTGTIRLLFAIQFVTVAAMR
jgi:hypothetical protein